MSATEPVEKRHPWEFIEDLLAEAEAERVGKLTDAELEAELRALGIDPGKMPTFEQLLERGKARAAGRTRKQGAAPVADNVRALPVATKAGAADAHPRRMMWLAAAVFLLAAGGVAYAGRGAIVALFKGRPPPSPSDIRPDDVPPESPAVVAGRLLDEATKACDTQFYGICARKLDAAAKLLPAGEDDPRIKAMREFITTSQHHDTAQDKMWLRDAGGRGAH